MCARICARKGCCVKLHQQNKINAYARNLNEIITLKKKWKKEQL
nr:MAG TPA: hypothetical protein [Caudoviricetes sp.]DAW41057.1 MAG TPA: hypothetical protein [Caudoviricetes sp.]